MTLQKYTHVRNSSVDSADIHKDLSRMPSFIMEDEHTKWGRLRTKISKIFTKEDIPELIPAEFFDKPQPQAPLVHAFELELVRKKAGLDRAKSFKKAKDLPKRRKTSLPGPQRQLSKKWTKSRHTPSHPPVVGKAAHPLSFICSSQNPLISLPSTMSATLDQLEDLRQDSISPDSYSSSDDNVRVNEWIEDSTQQQPQSPTTSLSSFGNESDISWTPFKSQPSMPIAKQQEQARAAASWNAYPNHVPSVPLKYHQSDTSLTIVDRSNVTSELSTPVWSAINSKNNSMDDLKVATKYQSLNSFDFRKRSPSIGLAAAVEKALPNPSMYELESLPKSKAPPKPKTKKSRAFGLLEALEMEEDDYGMDSEGESIKGERQLTFMEALMEMDPPTNKKMQAKDAGFVPKIAPNINSDCSTSHRGTQSTDIRESMDIYSDIYCSSELMEFDDLYFGDEQNVYIVV